VGYPREFLQAEKEEIRNGGSVQAAHQEVHVSPPPLNAPGSHVGSDGDRSNIGRMRGKIDSTLLPKYSFPVARFAAIEGAQLVARVRGDVSVYFRVQIYGMHRIALYSPLLRKATSKERFGSE